MNNESNRMKNSMWDTWDGVKFYPRPYDMDTQMGLSNTGTEIIRVDSEIIPSLSPTLLDGDKNFIGYSYTDTTTDLRYMNYNTRTSKLWNAFGTEFKEEIKKAYTTLRNAKVYDVDNIFKAISADTDDKIGKIYFNKDAASKYLSQTTASDSTYLQMLHGNRAQKYKKFLKERLIFLDTVFGYEESAAQPDTLNSYIGLRSDAAYGQGEGTTLRCYVGVSVYSPQYVTITIGSGADGKVTGYVGPESRYKDPDTGIEYEGALFSFPIKGINKEMGITGAGNIKQINRLQTLNLTEARIEKALKLLELDVSYSNRMEGLKIGNNKYLRHLNCTNSYRLGTATESQTLDLSNCVNLKTVDLSYTKFTGVMFPTDTVLNSINLTSSSIKNVSIDGAEFLDDIKITNCENINKFELNRCNRIAVVDVANSTIQNFIVTNCENVTEVNLSGCKSIAGFDVTNSYNIVTLNMSGNTSPVMNDLKLYSMYKLNKLIISQTDTVHTLRLPKYLNEEEAFKAVNGDPNAKLWDNLTYLDASTSSIRKIQYGSADVDDVVLDMSQLKKLTTLKLSNCTYFTEIRNINYTGPLASLFYNCRGLTKITGVLTNGNTSINSMFQQCFVLSDIDGLSLNFTGVTSANSTCDRCFRMKTPMLKKILYACGESLTSATGMCHMAGLDGYETILGTAEDTTRTIPSDLFAMNTKLQNVSGFFDITGYTTVPGDLFDPCGATLTNCNNTFGRMRNLTTVGASLLHNKPNLTTVSQMFASDGSLTDYINESPDIFIGSYNITSTKQMFNNCTNLAVSEELGLGEMMKPLTYLTDASFMFFGCSNNLNCEIPDGFLSTNTKLVKINGMFQNCSKLPKLPASLFNKLGGTAKFPNLTKAVGVFGNCTSMEGIVESTFFLGAENLLNIGMDHEDNTYMGTTRYTSRGIFEGTQITGYHETFLNVVPKVQNVSGMFRNCTSLKDCHYYKGSQVETRNNGISEDLFIENKLLSDTYYMFAGCSSIEGHIPRNLLVNSKSLLKNVSYMFLNCSLLTGVNLDATSDNDVQTGICAEWFKNGIALTNVAGFMQGCSLYTGQIPDDMLEGCASLQRTDNLFNGCKNIVGSIPLGLFDACRKTITTTASMFASCEGLDQPIPVGQYNEVEGIVEYELVAKGTEGAMQVVEVMEDPFTQVAYSDVVTLSPNLATIINASGNYYVLPKVGPKTEVVVPGLLANCIQLTSIASMFYACKKITGGIPHDLLFTENNNIKYTKLQDVSRLFYDCEKISELYHETETGIDYICSPMLFDKCPELVNCSSIFRAMPGIPSTANIHPQMFSKQNKVTNISCLFRCTNVTGAVSPLLFANSINTITSAAQMFAFSKVSSIGPNFLNGGGRNTKLKNIYGMFYGCSSLEGTAPEFWNGAKFTAMGGADSNGFAGALRGCTKLTNYATAQAANTAWTADQPIYGE